jgi:hypothetical protein
MQAQIQDANGTYFSILSLIKYHDINWKVQITLYKSEALTLPKQAVNKLNSFERKILWTIFGPTHSQEVWKIRYNDDLYDMYKDVSLSTYIQIKRIKSAGHVIRM